MFNHKTPVLPSLSKTSLVNPLLNSSNLPFRNSSNSGRGSKTLKISPDQTFLNFMEGASSSLTRIKLPDPELSGRTSESHHIDQASQLKRLMQNQNHNQFAMAGNLNQALVPKKPQMDYHDNFGSIQRITEDKRQSVEYTMKASSIATRQVLNKGLKLPSINSFCSNPIEIQKSLDQLRSQKLQEARDAKQQQEELLGRYRKNVNSNMQEMQAPTHVSSTNTGSSFQMYQKPKLLTSQSVNRLNESLYKAVVRDQITADSQNSPKRRPDELQLESDNDVELEFFDENFTFKDQLTKDPSSKSGRKLPQPDAIQVNMQENSSVVEIEELDIGTDHLKSDTSSPEKTGQKFFKNRNGAANTLDYSGNFKSIQHNYYERYFHNNIAQEQHEKLVAKSKAFQMPKKQKIEGKGHYLEEDDLQPHKNPSVPTVHGNRELFLDSNPDFKEISKFIKLNNQRALLQKEKKKQEEIEKQIKLKQMQRKKKIIEKKKEQDNVLNELFNYNLGNDLKSIEDSKMKMSGLGGLLDEESSSDEKHSDQDDDGEAEALAEEGQLKQTQGEMKDSEDQAEQLKQRILQEQQREYDEKMRMIRFKNRWNVDELIQPILNLEIIDMYLDEEACIRHGMFPTLPEKFISNGQYYDLWHKLFLYETYNQMINSRNESDKDKEIAKMFGLKLKNDPANKNFKGLLQKFKSDSRFIVLKLSQNDNFNKRTANEVTGNFSTPYPHLDSLKEFDLLLLSKEELDTQNVKKLTSISFLKDIQSKQGTMMAMVDCKRKSDKNYLTIRVDACHEKYINCNCSEYDYHQMFVYYFDSMSTRIREYRTVKSVEFYPNSQFILDPSTIPKRQDNSEQSSVTRQGHISSPINFKKRMQDFIQDHSLKFNVSQRQALEDVIQMNQVDFLLIQGPPGTGKTHTIKGIISMLNYVIKSTKKIMVCAPSNAAIDEIVTRLISKGGLFGQNEEESIKKVVRIGAIDYEPSKIVQQVMIGTKIMKGSQHIESKQEKEILEANKMKWLRDIENVEKITTLINQARGFVHQTSSQIKSLAEQILADPSQLNTFMKYEKEKKLNKLKSYQASVRQKLRMQEEQRRGSGCALNKSQRIALEKKIIENSQIICTTLAMSTNEKLEHLQLGDIDYLIVDEACQSVELNNLIPFEHQPRKVILVGDQQQLPATTFSENAESTKYSRSLFERFLQCGVEKVMLEVQYRMHPMIREFPSSQFYDQRLRDAETISWDDKSLDKNLQLIQSEFQPVKFYDLLYSREESSEMSKLNNDEVDFIEQLIKQFILRISQSIHQKSISIFAKNFPNKEVSQEDQRKHKRQAIEELKGMIGIISPYKSQVRQLKDKIFRFLRQFCDLNHPQDYIEINTVDAFQGREKDIIIFSCVRSSKERQLGFVSDYRRMNVAITRARHCLFVIGNSDTLTRDNNWKSFITYCKQKGPLNYLDVSSKNQQVFKTLQIKEIPSQNDQKNITEIIKQIKTNQNQNQSSKKIENSGLQGLAALEEDMRMEDEMKNKQSPQSSIRQVNNNEQKTNEISQLNSFEKSSNRNNTEIFDKKSAKGDKISKKSHDRSYTHEISRQPSISNKSSSYQSYKPHLNYSKPQTNEPTPDQVHEKSPQGARQNLRQVFYERNDAPFRGRGGFHGAGNRGKDWQRDKNDHFNRKENRSNNWSRDNEFNNGYRSRSGERHFEKKRDQKYYQKGFQPHQYNNQSKRGRY